jgi:ribonuclease I
MFKEMKTLTPDQQYDLLRKEATAYFSELGRITNAYFENADRDIEALEERLMAKKLEQWVASRNVEINNEAVNDQTMAKNINNEAVNEQT